MVKNALISGSSNGHSPVLNLSKTAGSGSVGEHSGSEAGASHRSHDDEEEEDNLSEELEDDIEKDEGEHHNTLKICSYALQSRENGRYCRNRRHVDQSRIGSSHPKSK